MHSLIAENPFRTLGVTSEATLKAINAAQGKMRALATIGRKVEMPLDMNDWLPRARHDAEALEAAKNTISLKADRLKAALCWFVNATEHDEEALHAVSKYEFNKAVSIWEGNPKSFSAHFNLATLQLLKLNTVAAVAEMGLATNDETAASCWLDAIDCADVARPDTLFATYLEMVLPSLSDDELNEMLHGGRLDKHTTKALRRTVAGNIHNNIVDELARCSLHDDMGSQESLEAIELLRGTTIPRLAILKDLWGEHSQEYQILADKVARALSECAIRYHNTSHHDTDKRKAMHFQAEAAEMAYSLIIKQKCYKDVYDIEGFQFSEPPYSLSQHSAINDILDTPTKNTHFSNILKQLLRCALPLCQIYDLQAYNKQAAELALYLKYISSRVASHFGHLLLDELNRLCGVNGKHPFGSLTDAWLIVKCLQKLQISKAYRVYEFDNLINQITNNPILKLDAKNWTENDEWATAGLFDFNTSQVVFTHLHTEPQMDLFIKRFPYSRFTARIKKMRRQKELEEQAAREADDRDWQAVTTAKQALTYLTEHPRGAHADEAHDLIKAKQEVRDKRRKLLKRFLYILAGLGILIGIVGIIILVVFLIDRFSFWNFITGLFWVFLLGLGIMSSLFGDNDKGCGTGCIVFLILASLAGWIALGLSCAEDYHMQNIEKEQAAQEANAMSEAYSMMAIENPNDFDFAKASDILREYYDAAWSSSLEEKYDEMAHACLDSAGWRLAQVDSLHDKLYYLYHSEYVDSLIQRHELINRFGQYCDESDDDAWRILREFDTYDAFLYYTLLFPGGRHREEAYSKMKEHTHIETHIKYKHVYGGEYEPDISIETTHD